MRFFYLIKIGFLFLVVAVTYELYELEDSVGCREVLEVEGGSGHGRRGRGSLLNNNYRHFPPFSSM